MHILHANEYPDIISWNDASSSGNQDAFIIFDKARFEKEVMYEHFKGATFSSFTRRLRRWNFQSSKTSKKARRYWQPMFKKNNFVLASKMVAVPQVRCRRRGTTGITCSTRSTAASQLPPLLPGAKWESQSSSSYNSHSDAMMGGSTTSFGSIASSSTISGDFSSRCHAPIGQQQYAPKQQYSIENDHVIDKLKALRALNRQQQYALQQQYYNENDYLVDKSKVFQPPIGQQQYAPKQQQYYNEKEHMYRVGPVGRISNDSSYDNQTDASQINVTLNNGLHFHHDSIASRALGHSFSKGWDPYTFTR